MSGKNQKPKKVVRNKGRDFITDYYRTNREITKEYDKQYKDQREEEKRSGKKRPWTATEKVYLVVIALGIIAIGIKYIIF